MTDGRSGVDREDAETAGPVSHRIIETIAERTGQAVDQLPRLYDVVDPEVLDRVVDDDRAYLDGYLQFEYAGHLVTVTVGGEIEVEQRLPN